PLARAASPTAAWRRFAAATRARIAPRNSSTLQEGASRMRIAFFASSLVSAYWNGAATYYRGIVRALAARGHRIAFYEPDAYSRQEHRDIDDPPWAQVVVYPATEEAALSAVDSAR